MRFRDKTILITGAGSGIGRASAELLSLEGVKELALVDRDQRSLEQLSLQCPIRFEIGDVSNETLWEQAFPDRSIDHAIINAGIAATGPIERLSFADWRHVLSVNLDGAFLTLRYALRAMPNGGSIVMVASAAGVKAEPDTAAYGTSKAGIIQLARIAAKESAGRNIRVNVIAPGGVETSIWNGVPMFAARARAVGRETAFAEMASLATPLKTYAKPGEIAEQIAFLLSDACKTMTGTVLISDGGYTL